MGKHDFNQIFLFIFTLPVCLESGEHFDNKTADLIVCWFSFTSNYFLEKICYAIEIQVWRNLGTHQYKNGGQS